MSRYNNYSQPQHASATSSAFNASLTAEKPEERTSHSDSEDGNYALYADPHKIEADLDGARPCSPGFQRQLNGSHQMTPTPP